MFSQIFIAIIFAAAGIVQGLPQGGSANCQPDQTSYMVTAGETCNAIAGQFGISGADIIKANPGVGPDCSKLLPDQPICLPN